MSPTVGRFDVKESGPSEFPSLDVLVDGKLVGRIDCLAVEQRVLARRQESGHEADMVAEADIEWALTHARLGSG